MPHRLAKLKQDVSGFLNLHDEEQILERITSQDWSGLALKPTLGMGRGVMATRFFRSGSVVCDYHGPVLKKDQCLVSTTRGFRPLLDGWWTIQGSIRTYARFVGLATASICYSSPRRTSIRTITVSEVTTRVVDYLFCWLSFLLSVVCTESFTTKFGHGIPKATSFSVSAAKLGAAKFFHVDFDQYHVVLLFCISLLDVEFTSFSASGIIISCPWLLFVSHHS